VVQADAMGAELHMHDDLERCLRAVRAKDPRFDGWFVTAVRTTGIYCRPSCPAMTPKAGNVVVLPSAAAAQARGFRACKRCRPDASPGSPEWSARADLVARAMRLIADGVVDRGGVDLLARRLGYSRRQIERELRAELGAGPLGLARAQRAQTARLLLETTTLALGDVALAAGFGSIRQFNDTLREVFATTPGELRRRAGGSGPPTAGSVVVRLPFRTPLWPDNLFGHLVATAVPGVEEWRDGAYRRTMRLPYGPGVVALTPTSAFVTCRLSLTDLRDLSVAIARCRRLLDLDADPVAVDAQLADDPVLAPLVAAAPGRRVPRTVDEHELALRAVLGQQVSTAAARTHAARLVTAFGEPIADSDGGLTHLFPTAEACAAADPAGLAVPASRRRSFAALATALATGALDLDPGSDRERARVALTALPGVGPWTTEVIAMRALGDPDAFPATDLGVRVGARRLGLPTARALAERSRMWRPWRAYAVQHVWGLGDHAVNRMPSATTDAANSDEGAIA
jgi:AraC family transcriptional regulator of adaptative response / DNA-3-methyladenine glycosylase II